MTIRKKLLEASSDLMAAKRAMAERCLSRMSDDRSRTWAPDLRLTEVARRSGLQPHAVGVGRKIVDGKLTHLPCVRLYVTQKLPLHLLSAADRIPDHIDGLPTDVVEAAPAYFAAPLQCSVRKLREQRPAQGGISGAHETIQAGTIAGRCRSRRPDEAGDYFVLGNCHTLANFGLAAIGSAVLQPSARDGGTVQSHLLGLLHRFIPVSEVPGDSNYVDAAVAKLDSVNSMSPGICTIGSIQGIANGVFEDRVHKHGRTTGDTTGFIDDPSIDVLIPLRRDDPSRLAKFDDQIRVRPLTGQFVFAQPGDSGALLLTKPGNMAVGLIFACPDNGSFAYANPIGPVVDALEIDLE